ncbi:MAG: hypothetical protein WCK98_06665 [bacterium]
MKNKKYTFWGVVCLLVFALVVGIINFVPKLSPSTAQASNPTPSSTAITGTDLNYRNGWFGNSFSGIGNKAVAHSIDTIAVDPSSGSVYTNTYWEEGGMQISQFRNGDRVKVMKDTFGWGRAGGQAVAVNSKYVYGAISYGGGDACAQPPGNLNQNGRLSNRLCGTSWIGFGRYKNTLTQGDQNASEFAPFPTGYSYGGNYFLLGDQNGQTTLTCAISGAVATETELYVSDYCNDKIQVFDAENMTFLREFSVTKPGKLALDIQGSVWVLSLKDEPGNHGVGDFKFTYTDTLKILHYTSTGTKLAQEIASPAVVNARGLAVNSRDDLLVAIGGEADRTNAKQQIYFYNNTQTTPTYYKALGEENGYYGGALKGQVKDGKFDWITGLAVDKADNIYISMQKIGVASYKEDGTKNWQVDGLLFVDSTANDPRNPNIYYSKWDKFEYDPNRPDGANWKHLARTYDFTKYPTDQRNWFNGGFFDVLPLKICYVQDKKFMITNADMANSWNLLGYRFDPSTQGEIAIPAFEIHTGTNSQPGNYIWVDKNGDGLKQIDEKTPEIDNSFGTGVSIDDDCGIWLSQGGGPPENNMNYYSPAVLNPEGFAPNYTTTDKLKMKTPAVLSCIKRYVNYAPYEICEGNDVRRIAYEKATDTMYATGIVTKAITGDTGSGNTLYKFSNWLKPNRALEWSVPLPMNTATGLRLSGISIAGDYIMAIEERSPNGQFIFKKTTGEQIYLSSRVQGNFNLGWVDIGLAGMFFNYRPDGTYVSTSEDDGRGKSFTYYLKPNSYNSIITGQLYKDTNSNATYEPTETGENLPAGTKVKLTDTVNPNSVFYPIINTYGDYAQSLPAGTYSVGYILPSGYSVSGSPAAIITATSGQINNTDSNPTGVKVANVVTPPTTCPIGSYCVGLTNGAENIIDNSKTSFTPTESNTQKFATADLSFAVLGGSNADSRFTDSGKTSSCRFRLKEFGVLDSDVLNGFDAYTTKLASNTTGGSFNSADKTFDVPYSASTGCDLKIPASQQNQPKWFFEIRVVRSDGVIYALDNAYLQSYGAIGGVSIGA